MTLLKLISDFEIKFNDNLSQYKNLLGRDYSYWTYFTQLLIKVANKIEDSELFPECMYILMHHDYKPRLWEPKSFVLFLNYVDPILTKIFFCIIHAVIDHPNFGPYAIHFRKNKKIKLGYTTIRYEELEYMGFEFYDALVEIDAYFMKFIPVHRPMPFFKSRLPLCDLDVAQFRESYSVQRRKMLVISGLSRLLARRLFCFKESELQSQMKSILLRNF
jgi:hypothetical protein